MRHRLLVYMMAVAVLLHPADEACYRQYARQLHYPPYEYLDAEQRAANPRAYGADGEDYECDVGIERVAVGNVGLPALYDYPLPHATEQQDGWKNDIDHIAWYECDAESDDEEADNHQRSIYAKGIAELTVAKTQQ